MQVRIMKATKASRSARGNISLSGDDEDYGDGTLLLCLQQLNRESRKKRKVKALEERRVQQSQLYRRKLRSAIISG